MYTSIIDNEKLYGYTLVKIPTPKVFMLYNGEQRPRSQTLKLSNAFIEDDPAPSLELVVKVVNINYGSGEAALDWCAPLNGYSFLIAEIRKHLQEGLSRDEAIVKAINLCIENGILEAFLKENYLEVVKMLNYEYDAEAERRVLAQESLEIGVEKGIGIGIEKGMGMGIEKGREEGIGIGIEKGVGIGIEKGREEGVRSVAKLLLNSGDSVDKVMAVTGLAYEEIESLRGNQEG
jgi:hypothetical protein